MEIFNSNKVSIPSLPTCGVTAKQKLAHEVASCIIGMMNRNDPAQFHKAFFSVKHHGDKLKPCTVYVVEGMLGKTRYKSGSKVCEAVLAELSRLSKIDEVTVIAPANLTVASFSPDSPREDPVKKVKDALSKIKNEHFLDTDVRWTAESRSATGELLGVDGGEYGRVEVGLKKSKELEQLAREILEYIGNRTGLTLYFSRGYASDLSVEL